MSDILSERATRLLAGNEKIVTEHDMRDLLSEMIAQAGSQKRVAGELGVSQAYLGDLLLGRRPVSAEMAERLGWKKAEVFVKTKK